MGLGLKALLKSVAPSYIKEPADAKEALEAIADYCQSKIATEGEPWAPISHILHEVVRQAREAVK